MNKEKILLEILKKELDLMNLAAKALKRSWDDCQSVNYKSQSPLK